MKKLLYFSLISLLFVACSNNAENYDDSDEESAVEEEEASSSVKSGKYGDTDLDVITLDCKKTYAHYYYVFWEGDSMDEFTGINSDYYLPDHFYIKKNNSYYHIFAFEFDNIKDLKAFCKELDEGGYDFCVNLLASNDGMLKLHAPRPRSSKGNVCDVVIGSFIDDEECEDFIKKMHAAGFKHLFQCQVDVNGEWYTRIIGYTSNSYEEASNMAKTFKEFGVPAWVWKHYVEADSEDYYIY